MHKETKFLKELALTAIFFFAGRLLLVLNYQPTDILTMVLLGFLSTVLAVLTVMWLEKKNEKKVPSKEDEQETLRNSFKAGLAGSYFLSANDLAFMWQKNGKPPSEHLSERARQQWPTLLACAEINIENKLSGGERSVVMVACVKKIHPHGRYQLQHYAYQFHQEKAMSADKSVLPMQCLVIWHILECISIVYGIDVPALVDDRTLNSPDFQRNKLVVREMLALYFDATQLIPLSDYKKAMQEYLPSKENVLYSQAEKESHAKIRSRGAFDACVRLVAYWSEYSPSLPYFDAWVECGRMGWPSSVICEGFTDDEVKMTMTLYFALTEQLIRKDWMSHDPYIYGVLMADNAYQKGNILGAIEAMMANVKTPS